MGSHRISNTFSLSDGRVEALDRLAQRINLAGGVSAEYVRDATPKRNDISLENADPIVEHGNG